MRRSSASPATTASRRHLGASSDCRHRVDGVERQDEVGQLECQDQREVVVAILEASKLFLVVTSSRGFMRGTPIPYHRDEVTSVTDFADVTDVGD